MTATGASRPTSLAIRRREASNRAKKNWRRLPFKSEQSEAQQAKDSTRRWNEWKMEPRARSPNQLRSFMATSEMETENSIPGGSRDNERVASLATETQQRLSPDGFASSECHLLQVAGEQRCARLLLASQQQSAERLVPLSYRWPRRRRRRVTTSDRRPLDTCKQLIKFRPLLASPLLLATALAALLALIVTSHQASAFFHMTNSLMANNLPPKFVSSSPSSGNSGGASNSEIVVRVKEGPQSIGRLVYTLRGEDPDEDQLTFGVMGAMANELLRIENLPENQANVYLRKELDRETTESHQVVLTLTDGKLGRGNWITKSMLIIVEDVNDNYPVFGPHRTAISIREDARVPLVVETLEASDADEGRFGQVIYKLDYETHNSPLDEQERRQLANMFAIETIDGKGVLSLVNRLDYEQRALYQLRVLAVDRAAESERLSSATNILISVEDCPDQPPIFTFAPSITRLPESLPVGSPVLRVTAMDGDRGVNRPVRYELLTVNGQESGPERHLFAINAESGQISVARELDRESPQATSQEPAATGGWFGGGGGGGPDSGKASSQAGAYVLQVRASEVASGQQQAAATSASSSVTTELTVLLTDVNDELPTFSAPRYYAELLENSPAESLVQFLAGPWTPTGIQGGQQQQQAAAVARVFDRDQGSNGTFTLHLEGEHAHLFEVWPREATNEAQLQVKVAPAAANSKYLDYEQTRELHLTIVAREKQSANGPADEQVAAAAATAVSAQMTVYLRDANDNYPQFDSELYRVEIPENAIRGMHVCAVKALDADSGALGTAGVRYTEMRGEKANKFTLDPLTGVITLKTNEHGFDREQVGQHHLIVEARDNLGAGNRNTTQLLIVLTDANDQAPRFLLDQYEAFIYENEPDFQSPLQVRALDGDAPDTPNSRLTYSIVAGDPQQNFTIDAHTGRIRVRTQPASATTGSSGGGGGTGGLRGHRQQVVRSDDQLTSDIIIGDGFQTTQAPAPSTLAGLDFERIAQKRDETRQFNLTVRATDAGQPEQLSDTTQVVVSVYDRNDNAPIFTRATYAKSIREDAREGSPVLQVLALDGDHSPSNSKITYRIASGAADKFVVDSESGLVSVANGANLDIDRATGGGQRRTNYLLSVLASDGSFGPSQKSASALVNITILDVNNKPPEFVALASSGNVGNRLVQNTQTINVGGSGGGGGQWTAPPIVISEDAPYGLIVTRVVAHDLDSSAELRYSINYGRSEARNEEMALVEPALYRDLFVIEPTDGTIKVARPLDRELFDQVKLRLQVEDINAQTSDQVAHTHLLIRIADVNDNKPTFKRPLYKAVVNENSISGTSVITLTAEDRDLNKTLRYSLESHPSELIMRLVRINPRSGEVTVNDKIDRELHPLINLTVRAEDSGMPQPLTGTTQLLITVRDENDNNPMFLNSSHLRPVDFAPTTGGGPSTDSPQPRNHNNANNTSAYRLRSLETPPRQRFAPPVLDLSDDASTPLGHHHHHHLASNNNHLFQGTGLDTEVPLLGPGATVSVREDAQVGQQVAFVRAEDADLGNNGRVTYLLDASSSAGKFRIDRDTGIISVAQPLDRETQRLFTLNIEACDNYDLGYSTGESRRAFTQVNIQVTDINDNVPTISTGLSQASVSPSSISGVSISSRAQQALAGSSAATQTGGLTFEEAMQSPGPHEVPLTECLFIDEFQPINEPILTLTANDADDQETPNGQVDMAIINNLPQNELFGLVAPNSQRVTATTQEDSRHLPASGESNYATEEPVATATTNSAAVAATPTTTTGASSALPAADLAGFGDLLLGEESTERSMVATQQPPESTTSRSSVGSSSARRQRHRRGLIGGAGESQLEPQPNSFGTGNFYGSPSARYSATATSSLGGGQQQNSRHHPGRAPQGRTRSSGVFGSSEDGALNGRTTTTSSEGEKRPRLHPVAQQTQMQVVVRQSLKERVGNYTIVVRATDRGQPALSSVSLINICVLDVNNHAPVFVKPPLNHTIRIMENATIGSFVTQVEAADLDRGQNGQVHYFLRPTNSHHPSSSGSSGNDWQAFKIDRLTGIISTTKPFQRQVQKYYSLRVQAQDLGRPTSLSSDIDVNIMIVNAGKYQPEFEQQHQQLQFTENLAPGAEWFVLLQTTNLDDDPALINANQLEGAASTTAIAATAATTATNWLASPCYYIVDGDDHEQVFHLDRYTHRLTNQKQLDREHKANYTLLVQASNNCNKQQPILVSHSLNSADIEHNQPPSMAEGAAGGKRARRSTNESLVRSSGGSGPLRGKPPVAANISATTVSGEAQTALDQTSAPWDTLLAGDKSLLKVTIRVRDINDNAPKFTQRVYTGGITTEADFGTVFMIVQANDLDADLNGQVTYSIVKPIKRNFASNSAPLGQQQVAIGHRARVSPLSSVAAAGEDSKITSTTVTSSTDAIRQKRSHEQTPINGTTTSNRNAPIPAAAADEIENDALAYSNELPVAGGDGADELFVVNAQTGELSLNFDPQKHMKGYFEFEVMANDTGGLTDTARVFIYLLRQDQRVKFVLRLTPQELRQRLNKFRSVFGNITGAIVNIDSYKYYENQDGTVDKKRTSLFLHFVQPEDNTIIEVDKVLTLIDNNIEYLDELYKEFHVLSSEAAQLPLSGSGALVDPIDQVRTGLLGVSSFLALILVLVIALCLNQRTRYERQLKAATVSAFGSAPLHLDPDFHTQTNLPNTNLHSQDPNPIWINGGGGDQVDWLSGPPLKQQQHTRHPSGHSNKLAAEHHRQSHHHYHQHYQLNNNASKRLHPANMVNEVDIEDECNSTESSNEHSDTNSLTGGGVGGGGGGQLNGVTQLHYNVATTATPRDSLNSSHGQVSSSSGSGSASASTTNERQALCSNKTLSDRHSQQKAAATSTSNRRITREQQQQQQQKKRSQTPNSGGHQSTFGAFKEVTVYTEQHQQIGANSFAKPVAQQQQQGKRAADNNSNNNNLVRTVANSHNNNQQAASQVNKTSISQFSACKLVPPNNQGNQQARQSIFVTTNQQRPNNSNNNIRNNTTTANNKHHILIHANGEDVNQGIIKTNETGKQPAFNAKFVPINEQQKQQLEARDGTAKNFETSLSKLSILNLETTEL